MTPIEWICPSGMMGICIVLVLMLASGLSLGFMAGLIWHDDIEDYKIVLCMEGTNNDSDKLDMP